MGHRRPPGTGELLPPHRYIEIPNIEDRLFVNDEHMPLLLSSVGKRGLDQTSAGGRADRPAIARRVHRVGASRRGERRARCPGRTNAAPNRGDAIILVDGSGRSIDQLAYKADVLRAGRTICFGR
jgi:hypothetical protein